MTRRISHLTAASRARWQGAFFALTLNAMMTSASYGHDTQADDARDDRVSSEPQAADERQSCGEKLCDADAERDVDGRAATTTDDIETSSTPPKPKAIAPMMVPTPVMAMPILATPMVGTPAVAVPMVGMSTAATPMVGTSTLATPTIAPSNVIRLILAVAWEGRDLQPFNVAALRELRAQTPGWPAIHFISPTYFLSPVFDQKTAATLVKSAFVAGDKLGMTLSGWKTLAGSAGVVFRNGPTFWGTPLRPVDCLIDCGGDIPVSIYPRKDLEKLVSAGIETLDRVGFGRPQAMTVSGWAASPDVLQAAAGAGILYDFSAVAPEIVARRARRYPLYQWVKGLWANVKPDAQPAPADAAPTITEVPLALASVDYVEPDDLLTLFKEAADRLKSDPRSDVIFPLVIDQESARQSLPRMLAAFTSIRAYAMTHGIVVEPFLFPGLPDAPAFGPAAPLAH